jgi:hypothetical protein
MYLADPSSSTSWAAFVVASGGGGGIAGDGHGGGAPREVAAFTLLRFGAELFSLPRTAFGFTADPSPVTAAAPACGSRCVPARRRFTPVVDDTLEATSAGVTGLGVVAGVVDGAADAAATTGEGGGGCAVPTAAGGVATAAGGLDSRLIGDKSDGGGAEEGEGAQIGGGGGGWEELNVPSRAK